MRTSNSVTIDASTRGSPGYVLRTALSLNSGTNVPARCRRTLLNCIPDANIYCWPRYRASSRSKIPCTELQPICHVPPPRMKIVRKRTHPPRAPRPLDTIHRQERIGDLTIRHGMGPVAMAALQLCRVHKVKPFTITSSQETEKTLVESGILERSQVIRTHQNLNLGGAIKEATSGNGIDALLFPEPVDESILVACYQNMASLGRITGIGGSLGKSSVLHRTPASQRGLSCFSLNMTEIIMKQPSAISR